MAREEKTQAELELMKKDLLDKHQAAVTAAYQYCCALPLGNERSLAFDIYENLRVATRVG